MNFWADFGASDEIRLTPIEDDKPKDAENSKFWASSDYLATAKYSNYNDTVVEINSDYKKQEILF